MNDELQRPATVAGVLLIPHEGEAHKLLKDGVGGSRPPRAWLGELMWFDWDDPDNCEPDELLLDGSEALILGCDGKVVPAGCFHALGFRLGPRLAGLIALRLLAIREGGTVDWSEVQAMVAHLGRLVLVNGDGVEVMCG